MALRTFIVEDSPVILENLVATLVETAPVEVVGHAPDEPAAIAALETLEGTLDLLIVDVFLRTGSGLGVLLAAARRGTQAHRIVLTNWATPAMREKCCALGAHRVFDKSTDLDALIAYCDGLAAPPADGAGAR